MSLRGTTQRGSGAIACAPHGEGQAGTMQCDASSYELVLPKLQLKALSTNVKSWWLITTMEIQRAHMRRGSRKDLACMHACILHLTLRYFNSFTVGLAASCMHVCLVAATQLPTIHATASPCSTAWPQGYHITSLVCFTLVCIAKYSTHTHTRTHTHTHRSGGKRGRFVNRQHESKTLGTSQEMRLVAV